MSNSFGLPYITDYAKSGRAQCRWCRDKIGKGELRLAAMVQSKHHDGKDPFWYHHKCFFAKYRYLTVQEISNFNSLQLEDQELIKKYLDGKVRVSVIENPQKSGIHGLVNSGEFHVQYAKSNLSHCVSCDGRIAKGEVRISQMDYTSERALLIPTGKMDRWHHMECFVINREKLEFFGNVTKMPGFALLKESDRKNLWISLSKSVMTQNDAGIGKGNSVGVASTSVSKTVEWDQKGLEEQEKLIASFKDTLTKNIQDKDLISQVLASNNQEVPVGVQRMQEHIADMMAFGALERCQVCSGQLQYKNGVGYQCTGYINLQMKCGKIVKEPLRFPFEIPENLKNNPAFQNYTFSFRNRILPVQQKPVDTTEPPRKLPKIDKLPLKDLKFLISDGITREPLRIHLKNQIGRYGGKVVEKSSTTITAIVSTQDEVRKMTRRMTYAKKSHIPVISADFANAITEVNFNLVDLMKRFLICDWNSFGERAVLQSTDVANRVNLNKNFEEPHLQSNS